MDSAVPSVIEEPWFTKTRVRYRLTAIAVDRSAGPHQNYTVIFVGSEAGVVLKILAKTRPFSLNDSVLLEEIDAYNHAKYLNTLEYDGEEISGLARCPFDARQTNVALFAESDSM
ncbi:semaphorin-6D-like [Sphaerodactylus townsendi]|uniref:semaphorin-6D-like n=1 Tax=Sphaerodactylus townsendi TaxID=933632 RepID=UPI002025CB64|nr:semaphorin-6D-like [Sphaerodactylus townsendi]